MKLRQLKALAYLRWHLGMVSLQQTHPILRWVFGIFLALLAFVSLMGIFIAFGLGVVFLPKLNSLKVMAIWDLLVGGFLFFWFVGFLGELQKSEPISIERLLHLPVSVRGAHLLNFVGSLFNAAVVLFVPSMIGLAAAMVWVQGARALWMFPLLFVFLLSIAAVTDQLRGWLVNLLSDPRRRRNIIGFVTFCFIALTQLPNLVGFAYRSAADRKEQELRQAVVDEFEQQSPFPSPIVEGDESPDEKDDATSPTAPPSSAPSSNVVDAAGEADLPEADGAAVTSARAQRNQQIEEATKSRVKDWKQARRQKMKHWGLLAHRVLPPAWLPLGAYETGQQRSWPLPLMILGLGLMSGWSLNRSYRSTLNFYRKVDGGKRKKSSADTQSAKTIKNALEKPLPWLSPQVGTITKAGMTSLFRAPEFRVHMLISVIMCLFMCVPMLLHGSKIPIAVKPYVGVGLALFIGFMLFPVLNNQFGYDRQAFRAFVLMPVRARSFLLGKNLSFFPLLLCVMLICLLFAVVVQATSILGAIVGLLHFCSMCLLACVSGNFISAFMPYAVPPSAMQQAKPQFKAILMQIALMFLMPIVMLPVVAPSFIQWGFHYMGKLQGIPIALLLSLPVLAAAIWLYRWSLGPAERYFHSRKRAVLQEVTKFDRIV